MIELSRLPYYGDGLECRGYGADRLSMGKIINFNRETIDIYDTEFNKQKSIDFIRFFKIINELNVMTANSLTFFFGNYDDYPAIYKFDGESFDIINFKRHDRDLYNTSRGIYIVNNKLIIDTLININYIVYDLNDNTYKNINVVDSSGYSNISYKSLLLNNNDVYINILSYIGFDQYTFFPIYKHMIYKTDINTLMNAENELDLKDIERVFESQTTSQTDKFNYCVAHPLTWTFSPYKPVVVLSPAGDLGQYYHYQLNLSNFSYNYYEYYPLYRLYGKYYLSVKRGNECVEFTEKKLHVVDITTNETIETIQLDDCSYIESLGKSQYPFVFADFYPMCSGYIIKINGKTPVIQADMENKKIRVVDLFSGEPIKSRITYFKSNVCVNSNDTLIGSSYGYINVSDWTRIPSIGKDECMTMFIDDILE